MNTILNRTTTGPPKVETLCRSCGDKLLARPLSTKDVAIILNRIRHQLTLGNVCHS